MKKTFWKVVNQLFLLQALSVASTSFAQNIELLECDECTDSQMRELAEIYTLQSSPNLDLVIISPSTGKFREFTINSSSSGGFLSGAVNIESKPPRSNQQQIESDIKTVAESMERLARYRAPYEYEITMSDNKTYLSAADGLNPEFRSGVESAIEELINNLNENQIDLLLIRSKLQENPLLKALKSRIVDMFSKKYSEFIISVPFADDSTLDVKLRLVSRNSNPYIKVEATQKGFFANGDRLPLNYLEAHQFKSLIESKQIGSAINALSFLRHLDSLNGISSSSSFMPINDGCLAVCTMVEWPDGRKSDAGCYTPPDCGL